MFYFIMMAFYMFLMALCDFKFFKSGMMLWMPRHHPHGLLQPLPVLASLWSSISMDFITNLSPFNSYDSILMVVDHLTKMVHFSPCTKIITHKGTSKLLFDHVFGYHSLSLKYNFLLWASIYTQVLEVII
jgi:hypothetical protein